MQSQSPSPTQSPSPLTEAKASSLEELINRSPDLTDAEVDAIVTELRKQREKWAASEAMPKAKKAPKGSAPTLTIDDVMKGLEL